MAGSQLHGGPAADREGVDKRSRALLDMNAWGG
jgi:hypothetical protein